jgi:predicted Rossmann fold flavoprotein
MTKRLVIVGGGAAGMCAAIAARQAFRKAGVADAAAPVLLLERNARVGIKIRISGGGKCNITHAGDTMSVLQKGFRRKNEVRFLKHAFYHFPNTALLAWLRSQGLETFSRDNGRIFPVTNSAEDVLAAFEGLLAQHAVTVRTNARVAVLAKRDAGFSLTLEQDSKEIFADALILATGGVSYSKVGTTGDGIRFAKSLGHRTVPLRAALSQIHFTAKPPDEWIGISLRSVGLVATFNRNGQRLDDEQRTDDVLITHQGITGPACLSISRDVAEQMSVAGTTCKLFIDFFPSLAADALNAKFLNDALQRKSQFIRTRIEEALPDKLVPFLFEQAAISFETKWPDLKRDERKRLVQTAKRFFLGDVRVVPLERGEVSAGGVSLDEVNPKTMASRHEPNLFFCGEMLDVAGEVGGFNLQAAYSTGVVAGENAVQQLMRDA